MSSRDVLITFRAKFDDVHTATQQVIADLEATGRAFLALGKFSQGMAQFRIATGLKGQLAEAEGGVNSFIARLQQLRALKNQIETSKKTGVAAFAPISNDDLDLIARAKRSIEQLTASLDQMRARRALVAAATTKEFNDALRAGVPSPLIDEATGKKVRKKDLDKAIDLAEIERKTRIDDLNDKLQDFNLKPVSRRDTGPLVDTPEIEKARKGVLDLDKEIKKLQRDAAAGKPPPLVDTPALEAARRKVKELEAALQGLEAARKKDVASAAAAQARLDSARVENQKRASKGLKELPLPAVPVSGVTDEQVQRVENDLAQARVVLEKELRAAEAAGDPSRTLLIQGKMNDLKARELELERLLDERETRRKSLDDAAVSRIEALTQRQLRLNEAITAGEAAKAKGATSAFRDIDTGKFTSQQKLQDELARVEAELRDVSTGRGRGLFTPITGEDVDLETTARKLQLEKLIEGSQLNQLQKAQALTQLHAGDAAVQERALASASGMAFMEQRLNRIRQSDPIKEALEERVRLAQQAEEATQKNISSLEQSALVQLGARKGGGIARDRDAAAKDARNTQRELDRINKQILASTNEVAQAQAAGSKSAMALEQRHLGLLKARADAIKRLADANERQRRPAQQLDLAIGLGGQAELMAKLRTDADAFRELQTNLDPTKIMPDLVKMTARFHEIDRLIKEAGSDEAKKNKLLQEQLSLVSAIERERRDAPGRGIPEVEDNEDFRQRQLAKLPGLERAFIGAFDDMGRRFQATLQFAISGALIFGVQQLIRRFVETAIEVERAFADIGTAFEFDIEAPRGSAEFENELSKIRIQVLEIADEFNVLPTEANKAAFQMVSRFGNVRDAMTAMRAQLLATKISTIDQAEALRSLSAVAENFAAATLFVQDGLSVQEKLDKRNAAAVRNYGKALDIASTLQQQFGVQVEDTLEGVGRLAPTFAKMGFSMEQTASIVGGISRELGLAGSAVADSINRSLGQLVEPGIRDQLLELAARNDALTLSFSDFATGEKALEALVEQFHNLEQVDPGAAFEVLNILGQRRELDVVAALFNTTELRAAMEDALVGAAGSAENRFEVLSQTIAERLASIGGGFERLAQNFSELGLLGPLKAAVIVLDELLKKANQVMEVVSGILNSLGGFGTAIKGVIAFTVARASLSRLAGLIAQTASFGATAFAGRAQASAARGGGGALIVGAATTVAAEFKLLASQVKNNRIGLIAMIRTLYASTAAFALNTRAVLFNSLNNALSGPIAALAGRFPRFAKLMDGMSAAFAGTGTTLATFAVRLLSAIATVGLFIFTFNALQNVIEKQRLAASDLENATRSASAQARKEFAANPEDFPAGQASIEARTAQILLENVRAKDARITDFFEKLVAQYSVVSKSADDAKEDLFDLVTSNIGFDPRDIGTGKLTQAQEAAALQILLTMTDLVPGTEEFKAALERELEKQAIGQATAEIVAQAIGAGARRDTFAAGDLPGVTPFGGPGGFTFGGEPTAGAKILKEALDIQTELADPALTEVAQERLLSRLEELETLWIEFRDAQDNSLSKIEGTIKSINERVEDVRSKFSVGQASRGDVIAELQRAQAALLEQAALAASSDTTGASELEREAILQARQKQVEMLQEMLAGSEIAKSLAGLNQNANAALREQLLIEERDLIRMIAFGTDDQIRNQQIKIAQLKQAYAESVREEARVLAEGRVAMARTNNEWFEAQTALIEELRKQLQGLIHLSRILDLFGDPLSPAILQAAEQAVQDAQSEDQSRHLDVAQRFAIASARLAGPINDRMGQLAGQLASAQLGLADAESRGDATEILEATVLLREAQAEIVQEQINRLEAFVEAQAGVNDQILSLKGQVVVANQQLSVAAQLFGSLSAEFNQAKNRLAQVKNELGNALLSLDDMNRRLGSDLSNSFEQAILDLQLLAEKLQAPNLGDLEKVQLLLDQQQGEMAAARAFFSTELFNLRFLEETNQIGTGSYLTALRGLLAQVDTTTIQGKEIFLEIQSLIDGLTDDISDMAFNVPTSIRLPTIFEVRRALAADQLGVNYVDNRQMDIIIDVRDATDVEALVNALATSLGGSITSTAGRFGPGGAGITLGAF